MNATAPRCSRERGAALMLVLWLLVLLTALVVAFALSARVEGLQGRSMRQASVGRYLCEAGIEVAALRLASNDLNLRWVPDGRDYAFELEGRKVVVQVRDEGSKLDLNVADAVLMSRLFELLGQDRQAADRLAAAIVDWRDPDDLLSSDLGAEDDDYTRAGLPYGAKDRPFDTISELRQVLGMDPALYPKLAPHITVHTGQARPNPAFASPLLLAAMGHGEVDIGLIESGRRAWQPHLPPPVLPGGIALAAHGSGTYDVSSRTTRSDGATVEVTAVLRMGTGGAFGRLYTPLSWRVGEPD
jgi:general secretion pathway protein K